ncbi:DNA polymerase III subunit gamma/tau [Mycoplasmopsis phocirhinis]|uniref:DNA polymerase III subunit gamma/tau n=1 Tax=Mycoplasmopsis phocirhinis TaxID=142650 RepID=A0A4P6MS70_9BACT|nr:DNA polymerase III subunit gamma/tau [Mycoplasmopsis phocirhinis]QBF34691.1 DNA polymerase III subunit gamma/tau [Mycoplasmopsis phocirhinis]
MIYKALYRKYRPRTFDEVKGQEHIVQTLKNIILNHKISHAYLFCGPRGVGKTSVAKIFASTLNCAHEQNLTKICDYCLTNSDTNFDIIEMDAASNNGVKEIRELRDKIQNQPANGKYKVYIIDEVHMLSKGAFNALLKTLEEPPAHAIFILATTDPQKIPLTILSRVQRYNFRKISLDVIITQLKNVLTKENIKFEDEALTYIARLAAGGLRDALSIADQALAYGNGKISLQDIIYAFGISSNNNLVFILNNLFLGKINDVLELFENLKNAGLDPYHFAAGLMAVLKDYLIFNKTFDPMLMELLNESDIETIVFDINYAFKSMDIIYKLNKDLIYSQTQFQLIELALIKMANSVENSNINTEQNAKNNIYQNLEHKGEKMPKNKLEDTVKIALEQTQEMLIEANDQMENTLEINNDILSQSEQFLDDEGLISTAEFSIDDISVNESKSFKLIPNYRIEYKNKKDYVDNLDEDFLVNLLNISNREILDKYKEKINILSQIHLDQHQRNFAEALKDARLYSAGEKFMLFGLKEDPSALKYLEDVSKISLFQNFVAQYFDDYKHIFLVSDLAKLKRAAKTITELFNTNQRPKPIILGDVEFDKHLTPTKMLFEELND